MKKRKTHRLGSTQKRMMYMPRPATKFINSGESVFDNKDETSINTAKSVFDRTAIFTVKR